MLHQQRDNNGIVNNGRSVPQTRKDYSNVTPIAIPIPGRVVGRPVSSYHPSSSGFFSSSEDESDGSLTNSSSPPLSDTHMLSSSYHGVGFMTTGSGSGAPLNVYGTSPRTSVMFNYYSSPKGSYARHHPQLVRARSSDNPSYVHHVISNGKNESVPRHQSSESLDHHLDIGKKSRECKITHVCKAKGVGKLAPHIQQQVDNRPRAWSESDKTKTNNSMQTSRVSALRKLKMKLGQKGTLKRQKSVDEDDKGKPGNAPCLERLEEGRQLNCASVAARLQNLSLEPSSFLRQEHETGRRPERRVGVVRYTSPPLALPQLEENPEDCLVYQRFLEEHTCYDLMPTSSKLVVLDTRLEVKKAFHALIENSLRSAPLWDNELQNYVGLLTVSDFVSILLAYHKCPNKKLEDLENQKISCWRKILNSKQTLIHVTPQASLLDAINSLTKEKIRRLAIVDPNNGDVFHVINYRRILHFLHLFINELPKPRYLSKSIGELGLATPKDVATVSEDSPVIEALKLIDKHKVSGLPVLDSTGHVTDVFTKTDVLVLAGEQLFYDLSIKVSTVISLHSVEHEDSSPPVNRMMPGSPALVRRRNQPRAEQRSSTPVKPHPFLRDADNTPRLMPSPLVTSLHGLNQQSDIKKAKEKHQHGQVKHSSGSHGCMKGDPPIMSPSNNRVYLHRRRHLSNHLSKSTSISSHLVTVTKFDTLEAVMNSIVTADVLQAVVVDDFDQVQGVISIGDILRFMVFPTDENGRVIESRYKKKPPLVRSRSAKSRQEISRHNGRVRTVSDDSDITSSLIRKNSHSLASSMADSAYSECTTETSFSSYQDKSSSDKLLMERPESEPNSYSKLKLKSGEFIERL